MATLTISKVLGSACGIEMTLWHNGHWVGQLEWWLAWVPTVGRDVVGWEPSP